MEEAGRASNEGTREDPAFDRCSLWRYERLCQARRQDSGVKLALENHGDLQAREVKALVEEAGTDIVGVLLDSANPPYSLLEDPHLTLEMLGPLAVLTHVRDTAVWRTPEGIAARWVRLGEGNVDMAGWVKKLAKMRPDLAIGLEIIVSPEPNVLRIHEPQFWKDFSKMPAWEFSRFLAYVDRGKPVPATPLAPGKTVGQQQCDDLAACVQWTRDVLRPS